MNPSHRPFGMLSASLRTIGVGIAACLGLLGVVGSGTVRAGEYIGEDVVVSELAAEAVDAFERWESESSTIAFLTFVDARDAAAKRIEHQLALEPDSLRMVWASAGLDGQRAVLAALSQVGVPYRRYASEEGVAFDCSGLTSFAWAESGVELPRSSRNQYRAATQVPFEDATVGDLAWYPGHIMLYLGVEGLFVHSPTRGRNVEYGSISDDRLAWVRYADPTHRDVVTQG